MIKKKHYGLIVKISFILTFFTAGTMHARAQLTGMQSVYFENQYLSNPAMAGLEKGLILNAGYQAQWTTLPGSPALQNFTADYSSGNKVGLGLIVTSDNAGLINRTRIVGTYAYHLPLNETSKLNFGLSFGMNDTYIDYSKISGDQGDQSVQLFNERRIYLDGDLGMSYIGKGLTLQAAVPNLGSVFFNNQGTNLEVDRSTFFTAASYKFPLSSHNNNFTLEPKVAFRGIYGFASIFDGGFNLDMHNYNLNVSGIYHTNQSVTVAAGFKLEALGLFFSYTNNTGPLKSIANNTFEFGLRYLISKPVEKVKPKEKTDTDTITPRQ